ncbi:TfuA-like protein [Streptomyces anulatus]|uniref:TfuA-like protein n=1 Tax=Streptomyces anulatus TaxID=1892 RepID=UPI002E3401B9|nr:TfuA-like protein [Streptomyces anulatus]WTD27587.1 TfuA-like protein [Streptomyces anulatus]
MTAFVFVGPTLREEDRPRDWDVTYLPPVEQGHVHALVEKEPTAIGIIDGRFHDVPAVWHKEILWALRSGVPVYGSASMGALRAAELAPFGMRGIGRIYEQYRDGTLEDDDEVTVAHAGGDDGFTQLSDAMVNIRAALRGAVEQSCIGESTHRGLLGIAKGTFYAQRNLRVVLSEGRAAGLPSSEIDALTAFLRENPVDQKKDDAIAMLAAMRQDAGAEDTAVDADFTFEHNAFFDQARHNGLVHVGGADGDFLRITQILNEVRLDPSHYLRLRRSAIGGIVPSLSAPPRDLRAEVSASVARFRENNGLTGGPEWQRWLLERAYTEVLFASLIEDEVLSRHHQPHGGALNTPLLSALRSDPAHARILRRTEEKKRFLEEQGLADPAVSSVGGVSDEGILRWYFASIGRPFPDNVYRYATSLDFPGGYAFMKAVREEYHFRHARGARAEDRGTAEYDGDDLGSLVTAAVREAEWKR